MKLDETFEEYWNKYNFCSAPMCKIILTKNAWIHQQEKIDELRECIKFYANRDTSWRGNEIIPQDVEISGGKRSGGKYARRVLGEK